MWTPATRQQHSRPVTRYQTDLTDAEWRVIAPYSPQPCATGRLRESPVREIINGCPWRLLPRYCRHGRRFTAGSLLGTTTGALNG
jgi:hypothetical protein